MLITPHALSWSRTLDWVWLDAPDAKPHIGSFRGFIGTERSPELIENADLPPEAYLFEEWYMHRPGESDEDQQRRVEQEKSGIVMYFPAENPTLFEKLAKTEPSREGILRFAQKFGTLGIDQLNYTLPGDPLSGWIGEILLLNRVYRMWVAVRRKNEGEIERNSKETPFGLKSLFAGYFEGLGTIGFKEWALEDVGAKIARMGPIEWALADIGNNIARSLGHYGIHVTYQISPDHTGVELVYAPYNLIGLIWLQAANLLTTRNRWKVCTTAVICSRPKR